MKIMYYLRAWFLCLMTRKMKQVDNLDPNLWSSLFRVLTVCHSFHLLKFGCAEIVTVMVVFFETI